MSQGESSSGGGGGDGGGGWGAWASSWVSGAAALLEQEEEVEESGGGGGGMSDPIEEQPSLVIDRGGSGTNTPPTPDEQTDGGGGLVYGDLAWVNGLLSSAKQQGWSAAEFLKKDLAEFASTVYRDTSDVASSTSRTLQTSLHVSDDSVNKMTDDVKALLGSLKQTVQSAASETTAACTFAPASTSLGLYVGLDSGRDDSGTVPATTASNLPSDPSQSRLSCLRKDKNTYISEPSDDEGFGQFQSTFQLDEKKSDISNILISEPDVRLFYSELVPSQVSHQTFWTRYFYRVWATQLEEERKSELLNKVQSSLHEDLPDWGEDDDDEEEEEVTAADGGAAAPSHISPAVGGGDWPAAAAAAVDSPNDASGCDPEQTTTEAACSGEEQSSGSATSDEWVKDFEDSGGGGGGPE